MNKKVTSDLCPVTRGARFRASVWLRVLLLLVTCHLSLVTGLQGQTSYSRILSLPVQTSPDSTYSIPASDASGNNYRIPFNNFGAAASDTVFGSSWNGVTSLPPTKNAVYDALHLFDTDDDGKVNVLDLSTAELVKTNSSGVVSNAVAGTDYLAPAAIGTTVQAFDSDLSAWAAITPGAGWAAVLAATKPTTLSGYGITDAQGLDGDLTSLAGASASGIYYKTGVSSNWAAVTIGGGLSLSTGTLSVSINGQTEDTSPASGDFVLTYDISASALKKVTLANLANALTITGVTDATSGFTATFDTTALSADRQFKFANGTSVSVLPASGSSSAPFATGIDSGGNLTFGSNVTAQSLNDADQTLTAGTTFGYLLTLTATRAKTLPLASNYATGATITIADASGSASSSVLINVTPNGSETINGSTSPIPISLAYGSMTLRKVGNTAWETVPTPTTTGQAISQATSQANARSLIGLGSASVQNTGTSGANVPLMNAGNTWSAGQTQHFAANNLVAPIELGGSTADPSTVFGGGIWFRSDVPALKYYDGTANRTILTDNSSLDATKLTGTIAAARLVGPYQVAGTGTVLVSPSTVPADICTITVPLPSGVTRWRIISATSNIGIATAASGTLAAASFTAFDTTGGGGNQVSAAFNGPAAVNNITQINANAVSASFTSATIVIRQTVLSANAGTLRFNFTIYPIL